MTAPSSPGGGSPLQLAGVVLIGVGVLAGVVGLFGGIGNSADTDNDAAAPPTSVSAPPSDPNAVPVPPVDGANPGGNGTGGTAGTAPGGGGPGAPGGTPVTPGAPGTPGAPVAGAPAPAPAQPEAEGAAPGGDRASAGSGSGAVAAARPAVRVYNNSTIKGLAEKAAEEFRATGWTVSSVQNYARGIIPATTVYYRPGTAEKSAADEMARRWGMRSQPRFAGIQDATPGLIVIITKDFKAA